MNTTISKKNTLIKELEKLSQNLSVTHEPDWLTTYRQTYLTHFETLGIPSTKDEEWKYTNLSSLNQHTFELSDNENINEKKELDDYIKNDAVTCVFVNGRFSSKLSNLSQISDDITLQPLNEAFKNHSQDIHDVLHHYSQKTITTFASLNHALTSEGIFIKAKSKSSFAHPIHIVHVVSNIQESIITSPRTIIIMEPSSELTVMESSIAFDNSLVYFNNNVTDVVVKDNATLNYVKAQKDSEQAFHINNTRVWQESNANFHGLTLTTNTGFTRNNLDIVLNGEGSHSTLNSLYSMFNDQFVDNHTSVDHRKPHCTSSQLYKGILNHSSRAVFNGKVFVRDIAQLTNSYQLNKNLLLGKEARVDTKPQLEINADDVKCTHGATIGQLDEDEIFYLQTRCIARNEALKILVRGFAEELIDEIKNPKILDQLHQLLQPSFDVF